MNIKDYFNLELKSTIIHALIGAMLGYVSFTINQPLLNTVLAIAVLVVTIFIVRLIFKVKEKAKWWISNGIVIFIFLWLVVYTIFYNMNLWNVL